LILKDELVPLLKEGVRGFKCFMCPSGVDEFPQVKEEDLEIAFQRLQNSSSTILVHSHCFACFNLIVDLILMFYFTQSFMQRLSVALL
jgi:hypothetical protein